MIEKIFSNYNKNKIAFIDQNNIKYSYGDIARDINYFDFVDRDKGVCFLEGSNDYLPIIFYIYCLNFRIPIFLVDNINDISQKYLIDEYNPKYIFLREKLNIRGYYLKKTFSPFNIYQSETKKKIIVHKKISLLLSTSGTLGSKKFVKLSMDNISTNAYQIKKYLKINSKSVTITTLPFNYSYGLSIINSHLISGAKIILNKDSVITREFKNKINKFKVTNFGGVPYTYVLLNKIRFFETKYPSLNYITQAGGRLNDSDKKKLIEVTKSQKFKLFIMYGQTEASPRISYLPFKFLYKKEDSIGIPVPDGSIKLQNKKNKNIKAPFVEGQIVYYGRNVSLGNITKLNDLSLGDENKGKLYTGDIGYFDKDNFFYITGRIKRIAKIFGNRINLDELQKILNKKFSLICLSDDNKLFIYSECLNKVSKIIEEVVKILEINKNFIVVKKVKNLDRNSSGKLILKHYK